MDYKTEIYAYDIDLAQCPVCGSQTNIKVFSAKSEKKVVTMLIQFIKTHFKVCKQYKGQKVELSITLNQRTKNFSPTLMTYESKKVDRKIIV